MEFENVTLLFKSEFFGLAQVYCRKVEIEFRKYAQYDRATWVTFRKPRQRKDRQFVKSYDQTLAIIPGKAPQYDSFQKYYSPISGWNNELIRFAKAHNAIYVQDKKGTEIS